MYSVCFRCIIWSNRLSLLYYYHIDEVELLWKQGENILVSYQQLFAKKRFDFNTTTPDTSIFSHVFFYSGFLIRQDCRWYNGVIQQWIEGWGYCIFFVVARPYVKVILLLLDDTSSYFEFNVSKVRMSIVYLHDIWIMY